ncbi:MAG: DUF2203 domain-containing protein [Stackebrandtia sp.]
MSQEETEEFTLEEARELMPEVRRRGAEIVRMRAELAELALALSTGDTSPSGGLPEAKALEARVNEKISWFDAHGIEVKGVAPLLVDFPAQRDGVSVRLCWLEGEEELAWFHRTELGFSGRRRIE